MGTLGWSQAEKGEYFAQNVNLVHSVVHRYKKIGYEYDDLFQMASVGLLKALDAYDTDAGVKLSTFVVKCMQNEILYETRKSRAKSRSGPIVLSYESECEGKDGNKMSGVENRLLDNIDFLHHSESMEEKVERKEIYELVQKVMSENLTETECRAIQLLSQGHSQSEIASMLDVQPANISKVIRFIRAKVILHMRRSGYLDE